ncbi:hypothetical protein ACFY3G_17845 [Streptomyces phaeochromogenes]|uniref:hypothetical protein n=1 Tax=Streptomyces phaeochromogenes TaxID=1923 RepID=UPI00367FF7F6
MSHDLLAELAGYQAEFAREDRNGRTERADAVREELDRVRGEIEAKAEDLEAKSAEYVDEGQDVRAAQAAVRARELRQALERDTLLVADPGGPREPELPVFVPHEHNVKQVLAYLDACGDVDEVRRVLDAEAGAPTPRAGILNARDEQLARFAPPQT